MKEKKVLVIDPEFESSKSLFKFLIREKFNVITAEDGEEGLNKAKTENPDLIILEPKLPKLHGFDLCSIISRDFEHRIPVIVLTKYYYDFKPELLRDFGAAAYLKKPFEEEELHNTLFDLFRRKGQIKLQVESAGNNGGGNNGKERKLDILSSGRNDTGDNGNNGNNENERGRKVDIDKMLKNVMSEFGVPSEGKAAHKKLHVSP